MIASLLALVLAPSAMSDQSALAARIAEERGRVVVVNFWAEWCEPCKREMPLLARMANEYLREGVTFVGASIDDEEDVEKAKAFARGATVTYPLTFGATTAEMIAFELGDAVPVTVILDPEGTPRFRLVGEIKEHELRERLDWLLAPGGAEPPAELVVPAGMSLEHFREDHEEGETEDHKHEEAAESGSAVPG